MKSLAYGFFIDFLKNILLISLVSVLFSYPSREFVTFLCLKALPFFIVLFFFFLTRLIFKAGCFWLIWLGFLICRFRFSHFQKSFSWIMVLNISYVPFVSFYRDSSYLHIHILCNYIYKAFFLIFFSGFLPYSFTTLFSFC